MENEVQYIYYIVALVFNLSAILGAKKIVLFLNHGEENKAKESIFKIFNFVLLITILFDMYFKGNFGQIISNIGYSLYIIYFGLVIFEVLSFYNREKFGTKDNKDKPSENYNTRINSIVLMVLIFALVTVFILQLWGMESALEQKGFVGMIIAVLVFTSSHWFPNIFAGLSLMNSNRISKGDLLRIKGKFFILFDMSLQFTTLLDVESNKRVFVSNKEFSDSKLANLNKRASSDGYRDSIYFNIGYPNIDLQNDKEYDKAINSFKQIFEEIYEVVDDKKDIQVKNKYELFLVDTGDYALKWKFSFYYDGLSEVNSTTGVRKVLSSKYRLLEMVQKKSHLRKIKLSTPMLIEKEEIRKE